MKDEDYRSLLSPTRKVAKRNRLRTCYASAYTARTASANRRMRLACRSWCRDGRTSATSHSRAPSHAVPALRHVSGSRRRVTRLRLERAAHAVKVDLRFRRQAAEILTLPHAAFAVRADFGLENRAGETLAPAPQHVALAWEAVVPNGGTRAAPQSCLRRLWIFAQTVKRGSTTAHRCMVDRLVRGCVKARSTAGATRGRSPKGDPASRRRRPQRTS